MDQSLLQRSRVEGCMLKILGELGSMVGNFSPKYCTRLGCLCCGTCGKHSQPQSCTPKSGWEGQVVSQICGDLESLSPFGWIFKNFLLIFCSHRKATASLVMCKDFAWGDSSAQEWGSVLCRISGSCTCRIFGSCTPRCCCKVAGRGKALCPVCAKGTGTIPKQE